MKIFSDPVATVAINLVPRKGSWGGANQWTSQLTRYLKNAGYRVRHDLCGEVDCIVMTHAGLSEETSFLHREVAEYKRAHPGVPCIQRINDNDIRKGTDKMDAMLAEAGRVADHTVFVSGWLRDYHAGKWFDASRPHSVIMPGADPSVFHPFGNRPPLAGQPWRVVTHHWSDNWSKGFDAYAKVDEAVAAGRLSGFELRVIGRWPKDLSWKSARTFTPASGPKLAAMLRECHLYITASRHEPGAMHPVEGAQCGLPVVFSEDSGGTASQCAPFGVRFSEDPCAALEEARSRYAELRGRLLACPPSGDAMCIAYRRLIQALVAGRGQP